MSKSLDQYIPKWIVDRIVSRSCSCGNKYKRSDITQIGIRKVNKNNRKTEALAVELLCSVCGKTAISTFAHEKKDFRQLLCSLLEEIQKQDRIEKSIEIQKSNPIINPSKISDQEINEFKKEIEQMADYNEFLKKLGLETDDDS